MVFSNQQSFFACLWSFSGIQWLRSVLIEGIGSSQRKVLYNRTASSLLRPCVFELELCQVSSRCLMFTLPLPKPQFCILVEAHEFQSSCQPPIVVYFSLFFVKPFQYPWASKSQLALNWTQESAITSGVLICFKRANVTRT